MKPFYNGSGAGVASPSGAAETVGAAAAPLGGAKHGNVTVF